MRYISLLRGINVGGNKKILMKDLKALYENLGFESVMTYIQSGNVLFETEETSVTVLEERIAKAIRLAYNFEVSVLVKTKMAWQKILNGNTYVDEYKEDCNKLYFTFLKESPSQQLIDKILAMDFSPETFYIINDVVYIYCSKGYGRTKLNNHFFEKKLLVSATTRNYKTIHKLWELALV